MTKKSHIANSLELAKSAGIGSRLSDMATTVGSAIKGNWRKLPGMVRYPTTVAGTAAFPTLMYTSGVSEAKDHVANTAYNNAYELTQARIADEWSKTPTWKRHTAAALGMGNSLELQNMLKDFKAQPSTGLMYESSDAFGGKKFS